MTTRSEVSLQVFSADMTLRQLLTHMIDKRLSHATIPYSDDLFVHIAIVFDREESSKLVVHLDKVTLTAIHKANDRKPNAPARPGEDS